VSLESPLPFGHNPMASATSLFPASNRMPDPGTSQIQPSAACFGRRPAGTGPALARSTAIPWHACMTADDG
jgi:hypothetical protein